MSALQEPLQRRPYTSVLSIDDDSKMWYDHKFTYFHIKSDQVYFNKDIAA